MTNEEKIKRWLAGELSDTEKKEFESTEEFAKLNKLSNALNNFKAPDYDVDSEYKKLYGKVFENKKSISLFTKINPLLKIAAIILITLTVAYFSYDYLKNPATKDQGWVAEQLDFYLPDSSIVSINSESKIRFSTSNWENERNIELKGEAFFKVKKGSKFNVETQQGTASVLGTEFGVKDWGSYYEVTCYSGLVKVSSNLDTVLLKPNKAFRIIDGKDECYDFSDKSAPDWLNGESNFKSIPLKFVIDELERQYKVSIKTIDLDVNQLFTGSFSHNNLEIALKAVTIPVNSSYKINDNQIIITFEGK